MKKLDISKTIQFVVFALLGAFCLYKIHFDQDFSRDFAESQSMRTLCFMLWIVFSAVFISIFVDFTMYSKNQKEFSTLKKAINSDSLSNLANRNSCDELIAEYEETSIDEHFTCVMLELTNLQEVNERHGRSEGNRMIKDFAGIVYMACVGKGFVGRNGGNKYMALFERDTAVEDCKTFLDRISDKIKEYNNDPVNPDIKYNIGLSVGNELEKKDIHALISLADRRLTDKTL